MAAANLFVSLNWSSSSRYVCSFHQPPRDEEKLGGVGSQGLDGDGRFRLGAIDLLDNQARYLPIIPVCEPLQSLNEQHPEVTFYIVKQSPAIDKV
jgi:hypothetical protein